MALKTEDGTTDTLAGRGEDYAPQMDMPYDDYDEDRDADADDLQDEDGQNKQQRLMRACDHCRRKKVKCNGAKPACTHCLRMRLECHYSPLVRKKRTRRSVIDKLQERLASMEQMLQPLVERLSPNDPVVSAGVGGFGLGFGFAPAPPPAIAHPLGYSMQPLSPHQPQGALPQHIYMQQPGAQSIARDPPYLLPSQASDTSSDPPLPPLNVIEELMEIAIVRMSPTAPPVSWALLRRRLHSGRLPEFIICAMVALAARFSNRPEFSSMPRYNAGRDYAKRAAELVAGLVDKPDPDVVFCLVMLSLYEWGCGRGESAWTYTGMATRLAQRCRLHLVDEEDFNENVDKQSYSWANAEWRRRLWWHVYCGDRTSVIVASRPATTHDDDCVVNLPSHDYEWLTGTTPEETEDAAAGTQKRETTQSSESLFSDRLPDSWWVVIELYRICSRISEFVNRRRRPVGTSNIPRRQMFDILDRDLEDVRSRFIPGMEFPPHAESHLNGYANMSGSTNGMGNVCAIYFNVHLMYHAAKIILYRSELPEYQHETISTEHIERAKAVCIDSAHKQADVIRWALDNVAVEDWDAKVGVWSLQGASIHVNAALCSDNVLAEQSRADLEVHLKLHVASDQYYHFNMAIITMLHHIFNLRKMQRLVSSPSSPSSAGSAADIEDGQANMAPQDEDRLVIQHKNDSDPWIVPRCSSFLGFTYNYSQLRVILNDAIKKTTYSPPETITEDNNHAVTLAQQQHHQYQQQNQRTIMGTLASLGNATSMPPDMAAVGRSIGVDISGGMWNQPGVSISNAVQPQLGAVAAQSGGGAHGSNGNAGSLPPASSGPLGGEVAQSSKRSYGSASGPGNNAGIAAKGADAQQLEQLQRLKDLQARVVLLQQLSSNQVSTVDHTATSLAAATGPAGVGVTPANGSGLPKDVGGFLNTFAESIGSVASQLGSDSMPQGSVAEAASCHPQMLATNPSWMLSADPRGSQSIPVGSNSFSNEELARMASQIPLAAHSDSNALAVPATATPNSVANLGNSSSPLHPGQYSAESIQGILQQMTAFNTQGPGSH
ncbi:hypothetical protein H4R20_002924 [Coemansia guatemalensis]|uniref:Zn(2)-C6 fungal-type domain-containing protein n=1 Tax=Coemansia guatemalensis TaxID=2761395 RepID=A0A9W8I2W1_9FUNG|nr:hypothetical protein H4R20_002924 [Coemansia guatemalensis]